MEENTKLRPPEAPLGRVYREGGSRYHCNNCGSTMTRNGFLRLFGEYLCDNKKCAINFKYLEPVFDKEFQTTNLLNDTIIHMWHQRERWSKNVVSTAHTMPNKDRFDGMVTKINKILDNE